MTEPITLERSIIGEEPNTGKHPSTVKVVQCSSAHEALDPRIFYKHCRALAQAGYEVVLIAQGGRDNLTTNDVIDGVRIRTISTPRSRSKRMLRTTREVYRVALEEDAQIYHFHDPELIPVGLLLKMHGKKVIYDVHEDLPLTMHEKAWIAEPLKPIVRAMARLLHSFSGVYVDGVVAATPTIARSFPDKKTIVVQNFPAKDVAGLTSPLSPDPTLIYVGVISELRGAEQILDALSLLPESLGVRLILAGRFEPASYEFKLREHPSWKFVDFRGWKEPPCVRSLLAESRIGLVVLKPYVNFLDSQPLKLFEYMAAGLPVIASNFPLWRNIVDEAGCGYLVDPLRPEEIAEAIMRLLENPETAEQMGESGRSAVLSKYNWEKEAEKLVSLYQRLAPLN